MAPEISDKEYKQTRLLLGLELMGIVVILFSAAAWHVELEWGNKKSGEQKGPASASPF
jgi:hypothetical protein